MRIAREKHLRELVELRMADCVVRVRARDDFRLLDLRLVVLGMEKFNVEFQITG